jgi:hypothetical protein
MNAGNAESVQQQGIFDTVKEKVNFAGLLDKMQDSRGFIVDAVIYGGVGFLFGYLIKRYINAVITAILMVTALFVMQQFSIVTVTVHWEVIYDLCGITQVMKLLGDNIMPFVFEWAKANVFLVVSWVVGFLVGIKVG